MACGLVSPEDGFCHEINLSRVKRRPGMVAHTVEAGGPGFQDHPGLRVSIFRKMNQIEALPLNPDGNINNLVYKY